MINEINRANSIITEFLSLAGVNDRIKVSHKNINTIFRSISPLIEADALLNDKEIKFIEGDIPDILINENEIRQLILNLVRNGLEAMLPGGILIVETYIDGNEIILTIKGPRNRN
jgi:signal transduction histidine kinase